MFPAQIPWLATDSGAQVQIGQLGLLVVRKIKTDFESVIFGKALKNRSVTLDDGKARAEYAARKWVTDAAAVLWTEIEPVKPAPTQTTARPGGVRKRSAD